MGISLFSVLEAVVLVTALSVDSFVASFAYGADKIKIPIRSVLTISGICSGILMLSLLIGSLLRPYIPEGVTGAVCFILLLVLGVMKLFDSSIKTLIRRHSGLKKKFTFSLFHLNFILNIYATPQKADQDHSSVLSPSEASALALALSLDGLTVGFGAGLGNIHVVEAVFCSFVMGIVAVLGGSLLGNKIAEKLRFDLSWLSGVLLILLAVFKIL